MEKNDYTYIPCKSDIENISYQTTKQMFTEPQILTSILNTISGYVEKGALYTAQYTELEENYNDLCIRFNIATNLINENHLLNDFNKECEEYYNREGKSK